MEDEDGEARALAASREVWVVNLMALCDVGGRSTCSRGDEEKTDVQSGGGE